MFCCDLVAMRAFVIPGIHVFPPLCGHIGNIPHTCVAKSGIFPTPVWPYQEYSPPPCGHIGTIPPHHPIPPPPPYHSPMFAPSPHSPDWKISQDAWPPHMLARPGPQVAPFFRQTGHRGFIWDIQTRVPRRISVRSSPGCPPSISILLVDHFGPTNNKKVNVVPPSRGIAILGGWVDTSGV